jgi:hypothetical protein
VVVYGPLPPLKSSRFWHFAIHSCFNLLYKDNHLAQLFNCSIPSGTNQI